MGRPSKNRKEIVDILKNIRDSLTKDPEHRPKSQTFSQNFADKMTSGKGFFDSIKEAIKIENEKEKDRLKREYDPLNIVKKMVGGNPIATTLAGKAMGKKDEDIRSSLGLPNKSKIADQISSTQPLPNISAPPSHIGGASIPLLEQMAKSLGLILLRITDIAKKMGAVKEPEITAAGRLRDKTTGKFMGGAEARELKAQSTLLEEIKNTLLNTQELEKQFQDKLADENRVKKKERSNIQQPPTQLNSQGKGITSTPIQQATETGKSEGGFFDSIKETFSGLDTKLLAFGAAVGALMTPFDKLKGVVTSSFEGIKDSFSTLKGIVTSVPEQLTNIVKKGGEIIKNVPEGVKDLATKGSVALGRIKDKLTTKAPTETPEAPKTTPKETPKESPKPATQEVKKTPEVKPEPKKGKISASKESIKKFLSNKIPEKVSGKNIAKMIPGIGAALGLGFAVSKLIKGDYVGASLEAISGLGGAATAIPAIVAELIRETYQDQYGTFPEADPLKSERLPELAKIVGGEVDNWLKGSGKVKEETSSTTEATNVPKVVEAPKPTSVENPSTSGANIAKSTALTKSLSSGPQESSGASTPTINVNNVSNQQTNASLNYIPSPRTNESSYLRATDRNSAY